METEGNEFEFIITPSSLMYSHPNSMHGKLVTGSASVTMYDFDYSPASSSSAIMRLPSLGKLQLTNVLGRNFAVMMCTLFSDSGKYIVFF